MNINRQYLNLQGFAGNISLISELLDDLQEILNDLNKESLNVGCKRNINIIKITDSFWENYKDRWRTGSSPGMHILKRD